MRKSIRNILCTFALMSSLSFSEKAGAQTNETYISRAKLNTEYPIVPFGFEASARADITQNPLDIFEPEFYNLVNKLAKERVITNGIRFPEPAKIYRYIMENKERPLDLLRRLLSKNQTLMMGEEHDHNKAKKFVADSLEELVKHSAIKFLAIEVESKYQKNIDSFINSEINAEELKKRVPYINNGPSPHMIKRASELGLRVIAMSGENRDEDMIKNLKREVFDKDPNEKGLVYIGNRHLFKAKLGQGKFFSLGAYLNALTNGKNATVCIKRPDRVSYVHKIEGIPEGIGFLTNKHPLDRMIFDKDVSDSPCLDVYYSYIDGIITVKDDEL